MPPTPAPVTVQTLHWAQHSIEVERWEESSLEEFHEIPSNLRGRLPQRSIRIVSDDELPPEASTQDELYDLIHALQDQIEWLSYNEPAGSTIETPPARCEWCAVITRIRDEGAETEVIGPMTKDSAEAFDSFMSLPDVIGVSVVKLTEAPRV